jgi:hypothetical protein
MSVASVKIGSLFDRLRNLPGNDLNHSTMIVCERISLHGVDSQDANKIRVNHEGGAETTLQSRPHTSSDFTQVQNWI